MFPAGAAVNVHDTLQFVRSRKLRPLEAGFLEAALRKEPEAVADAAHGSALHELGLEPRADDELGRAAAYVDHQTPLGRGCEAVRDAEVNQARFLPAEYHFDGKPKRRFGFREKGFCVFRYAQRARTHGTHRRARKTAQALAETRKRLQRPRFCRLIDAPVPRETRTQAHRISQAVEQVDLVVNDPADLQVEAVGSQVEGGQSVLFHDCGACSAQYVKRRYHNAAAALLRRVAL